MTDGIHGDQPIRWQIDRLTERAAQDGRKVVRIRAAKPFADNLAPEMAGSLAYPAAMWSELVYNGIVIETVTDAETGWIAYDQNGMPIDNL